MEDSGRNGIHEPDTEFMGLTTFAGKTTYAEKKRLFAKNYLNEKELRAMEYGGYGSATELKRHWITIFQRRKSSLLIVIFFNE